MDSLVDPQWYLDNVLVHAAPGGPTRFEPGPGTQWRSWWCARRDELTGPAEALAAGQGFVARLSQLRLVGWGRHDDRRELRRGTWTTVGHGVRSPVDVRTVDPFVAQRRAHALDSAAAVLVRSASSVSARSAAILHGLPTLHLPRQPELTIVAATSGRRTQAHLFAATVARSEVTDWFGAPVTCVARTLVDLARHDPRDAIMAADAALREELVSRAEITQQLDRAAGWPGVRAARDVLILADPLAESPLESLLRFALHGDGFPPPALQAWIGRDRVDLLLERERLVIEADGRGKYSDAALWEEKRREQRLRARGFTVERVLWTDVLRDWPVTSARLRAALRHPDPRALPR